MKLDSLRKLYVHELKDLYSAEMLLLAALPKMCEAASSDDLKELFTSHLKETKKHVSRLETIFKALDFEPGGHKCAAMVGLIKEGEGLIKSDIEPSVLDAGLIAASQRIEHYEMAGYGTVRTVTIGLPRCFIASSNLEKHGNDRLEDYPTPIIT